MLRSPNAFLIKPQVEQSDIADINCYICDS